MAERRMFSKSIIDSDAFIDMPARSRLLYFDLAMRADDEGFVDSPNKIIRMTGAAKEDLDILVNKHYIIPFESGVLVIRHWKIHNYIQKDRFKPTFYQNEKEHLRLENGNVYTLETECIQSVSGTDTQVREGKERLGKVRGGEAAHTRQVIDATACHRMPPHINDADTEAGNQPRAPTRQQIEAAYKEICRKHGTQPRQGFIDRFKSYNHRDWKSDLEKWILEDKAKEKNKTSPNRFINFEQRELDWNAVAVQILKAQEEENP